MKLKPVFIILFLIFFGVSTVFANFDREAFEIFSSLNNERRAQKVAVLGWDDDLADLAEDYSEKMAGEKFFSHTDSKGLSIVERAKDNKIDDYTKIGENLYYCFGCSNFVYNAVSGWLRSPSHKRNILDKEYTLTGIGIAESKDGKIYITQVFTGK